MNGNAPAVDGAKSLPRICSRAHWERGMAIAAAASSVVAENHGCEFGGHGGVVFLLSSRKKKCSCRLSALITRHTRYLTRGLLSKSFYGTYYTCTICVLFEIMRVEKKSCRYRRYLRDLRPFPQQYTADPVS